MDSSDEEGEIVPDRVTDYHFISDKEEPISFTVLPLQWSEDESLDDVDRPVYLRGVADDGIQKVYKRVIAWRFELSFVQPEISVLSKDNKWLTLQKPRKSFENIIRTTLVTIHLLHFVKKNPDASWKSICAYLFKELSSFDVQHSEEDLLNHLPLIRVAIERDKDLEKSKYLFAYMEKPTTNKAFKEEMQTMQKLEFMNDDDYGDGGNGKNDNNGDNELYDHVCAICDNGGEILCCEGRCMRSFHAAKEDGFDTRCESLGFLKDQVKALPSFMCQNCKHKQHQCFVCGKLGSSDKSRGAEVFPCACATCGHFYHPDCVAKLLHPANVYRAEELQNKIAAGESFTCPAHKCFVCEKGENKEEHENQFAVCRRCPKAYHRKCLPRSVSFECSNDQILQRAWDGLLPNRILMYCMDHEIIRELGTPARDHLKFPTKKVQDSALLASRGKGVASMKRNASEILSTQGRIVKLQKRIEKVGGGSINLGGSTKNIQKRCGPDFDSLRKTTAIHAVKIPPKVNIRSSSYCSKAYPHKSISMQQKIASAIGRKSEEETIVKMANSSQSSVDPEMESRIIKLMEDAASSISYEEIIKSKKGPTEYVYCDNSLEKSITMGKVEGSVEAIRTALSKLDAGGSIEDAKAVCEADILSQIFKWKRKLNVYLAPFLHGMRYTSFGRHFTKVDKLKKVVDRLHWYMQDGDTLVDFCCGSNDFSCLMKEKLEITGKHCTFKNYDIFAPKNDFNFEKRDWMTVNQEELPNGSRLIMGLNPPFGVKASLANKFIKKAQEFRPKLLILIVPKETKRLDEKDGYNLIWEDKEILSGKSFYLPGSVDIHNKQLEDWNLKAPPLYLWSRCDWSIRHKAIAKEQGHVWNDQRELHEKEDKNEAEAEGAERRDQTEGVKQGKWDGSTPCNTDGFPVDIECSTPTDSPVHSARQHEDVETSKMEVIEEGHQDVQKSRSGHASQIKLDQGTQTGNPTCIDSRPNFSSSNNLNHSWPHNFTYQSHGRATGTIYNFNQTSHKERMKEIIHGLPLNHNLSYQPHFAPNMGYGFQHFCSSPPEPLPPRVDYYQTSMVGGSGYSASILQSFNHSDPEPLPPGVDYSDPHGG
ncbi:protein ENHANCED DOWNY MILDEW 2 isoform X2 [Ziziphus jujuba]|uniref:Protein ENHANCED DOWNY MILDEW 2 isoform X2 n=1 Tax=Ziziphus jujuba TaxID=326968 RepID=A0ABM4A6Q4_ZIZJJ|nr:protein ENHANCED DOWNY MILDEW 2 isoform X2 [Ziziphus jujuba]